MRHKVRLGPCLTAVLALLISAPLRAQTSATLSGSVQDQQHAAVPGATVKAIHVTELRARLDEARAAIGVPAMVYTDPSLAAGDVVKAVHVQELRAGVK